MKLNKSTFISVFLVLLGTFIMSISINSIVIPNNLGDGGVTGISVLLFYLFDINPSITNIVINGFLLAIGWRYLSKELVMYTILSIISLSIFMNYPVFDPFIPENSLIPPIIAGVLTGFGIGLVVLGRGTTAGTDIIAMLLNKYFGIRVATGLAMCDIVIVSFSLYVVGLESGIMTYITIFVTNQVLNFILEGFNPKKSLLVISNHYEEIAERVMKDVNRGITVINGYGYYSQSEKNILYVVVNRQQLMPIQRIIHEIDANAFVVISDVQQVLGEGFTFYLDDLPTEG
ncbi:YitT family protein [Fundicoccus culcitae]|uniref:YitT family protein n=1 Tax=Fundicoccus culcitae TaxID=2969821 RepID=A0ABY5P7U5_9LACT|nr:YitT family protein [Fundicoccus culcitae]UUX34619.1 YitT family protein [Fundicoccus culcitae]